MCDLVNNGVINDPVIGWICKLTNKRCERVSDFTNRPRCETCAAEKRLKEMKSTPKKEGGMNA